MSRFQVSFARQVGNGPGDLDEFEEAADFNDRDIQQFAQRNVSMFEKHLSKVDQVEESNERISEGNADEADN